MFTIAFLLAAGLVLYTYAVFPLLLHWRARNRPLVPPEEPRTWPTVSIVIASHNEGASLPGKLASLEALDYPADKLQWIVVSDGSTDGTHALLEEAFAGHANRIVIHLPTSLGKCGALNAGVARATGEIILFMDSRQPVSANVAKALIPYLSDPAVGAASGELVLSENGSLEAGNFGFYWRYEKWIRHNESRLFSMTGVTGALYAIRRSDFTPNAEGTLLDDFQTPIRLLREGKRSLFVPGAYAFDKANDDAALEFRRKVRNLAGIWQSIRHHSWLLDPRRNPVWAQFVSHKVFRLLVPQAMIVAFVAAALGDTAFLDAMLLLQLAFYGVAAASYAGLPGTDNRLVNFCKVFLQMNAAAFVATVRYFASRRRIAWR